MTPPKHSGELRVDLDHVWINLKGNWRVQKTVRNCSRNSSWSLLTHEKYSKIHALERKNKLNGKVKDSKFYKYDSSDGSWIELDMNSIKKLQA